MHIAVDADDVVVDFIGGLLGIIKNEYGVEIKQEDIKQWDLHPVLDPVIGYSFWKLLERREWLWAQFGAIPGAIGAIDKLRRDGHYVELITSKPEWSEHNVWKWLGLWRPPFHRVTITKLEDRKVDFTDADILIDDKPQNCIDFLSEGRQAILFYAAHNRFMDAPKELIRAKGWGQVLSIIGSMDNLEKQENKSGRRPPISRTT